MKKYWKAYTENYIKERKEVLLISPPMFVVTLKVLYYRLKNLPYKSYRRLIAPKFPKNNMEVKPENKEFLSKSNALLIPQVLKIINRSIANRGEAILDAGCGEGGLIKSLKQTGYRNIWGFDSSNLVVDKAKWLNPDIRKNIFTHDLYNPKLPKSMPDKFKIIVLTEVIEHLYNPMKGLHRINKLLDKHGYVVITTPYHGYLKNLLIALTNKFDSHVKVDWEGGHVKFFSPKTISKMLQNAGFTTVKITGAGRVPFLWKSMVVIAQKNG